MNPKAAGRLRFTGYLVLVLWAVLVIWPKIGGPPFDLSDALATFAAIGIGLLLLAELGPFVKSLKAGGVEVEFIDALNDRFNTIDKRLAELELAAKSGDRPPPAHVAAVAPPILRPPWTGRPVIDHEDENRGRFGGSAESQGYRLTATFSRQTADWTDIELAVEAPKGVDLPADAFAEFHLHESFRPDVVPVPFVGGAAETSVLSWGGFTVGVWIPHAGVELELNLAKIRGAPRNVRER